MVNLVIHIFAALVLFGLVSYFLVLNPQWESTALTRGEFELLSNQAVDLFATVIGTDNPDLSRFRDRGGKVIVTHGMLDHPIPVQGSIEYHERVQKQMGGAKRVAEFARLFLMPGLNDGFRGPARAPARETMLETIIRWVEEGIAPDQLPAELRGDGKVLRTRPLFPYPEVARYKGTGDTNDAANYVRDTPKR